MKNLFLIETDDTTLILLELSHLRAEKQTESIKALIRELELTLSEMQMEEVRKHW